MSDAIRDYNWDQNTDTNWFDEFMGTSWSKQHSLSFQGSNDKGSILQTSHTLIRMVS